MRSDLIAARCVQDPFWRQRLVHRMDALDRDLTQTAPPDEMRRVALLPHSVRYLAHKIGCRNRYHTERKRRAATRRLLRMARRFVPEEVDAILQDVAQGTPEHPWPGHHRTMARDRESFPIV